MSPRPTQPVRRPRTDPPAPRRAPTAGTTTGPTTGTTRATPDTTATSPRTPAAKPARTPAAKPARTPVAKPARTPAAKPERTSARTPVAKTPTRTPVAKPARTSAEKPARTSAAKPARTSAARPAPAGAAAGRPTVPVRRPRTAAGSTPTSTGTRATSRSDTAEIPAALPSAAPRTPALHALYRARVSHGSVGRFAERARLRRRASWRPLAVVGGLVAALVLAAWVVGFSPLLSAREVQLVGADRVTQDEVDALVAQQLGRPLARLDADAVRVGVEALPEVESAQVLRVWPSTIEVRVTERVPVAAVPDPGGFSLVDADGVQVELVPEAPAGLAVVSAETVAAGDDALLAAARVLEALPVELGAQVTGTTAGTPDSVVLTLASGSRVVWGSQDESDRKAAVLQVLLATPAEVYDVSAPGTPVTR